MAKKIGIYTGTFDPVHMGHTSFAETALQACRLSEVVLIPEHAPRGKQAVTDMRHRLAMLERAVAPHEGLSTLSLAARQFTIGETLPELQRTFLGSELTLLIGSDVAKTLLYRWEGLEQLLPEITFAVGIRGDDTVESIAKIMKQVSLIYQHDVRYATVPMPHTAGISSSGARSGSFADLDPEVEAYIKSNGLYA
jgi:nicotinate-nucleotide adenylyltransferase